MNTEELIAQDLAESLTALPEVINAFSTQSAELRVAFMWLEDAVAGHEDDIDCELVDTLKEGLHAMLDRAVMREMTQSKRKHAAAVEAIRAWLIAGAK